MSERTSTTRRRRVLAIDLVRGGAVIAMIMVHTLWLYGDLPTQRDSWLGWVLHLLGKGTVSFLMAMGFSFMLSRDQSVLGPVRRGLLLMGVGYAMNILKFIVPIAAGTVPDAFIAAYGWSRPLSIEQLAQLVLTGDILQLAGVCLLSMGFIRRWSSNKLALLGWAVAVALGTHLLAGFRVGVPVFDYGLDLLWGAEFNVYFPVFPWFSSILVGMFFGAWYRDELEVDADQDRLFRGMLVMGLPLVVVGGGVVLAWPGVHFGDFFHLGAGGITYLVGLNLLIMWMVHRIEPYLAPSFVEFIEYCSQRVTSLYVISWTLLCWGMGLVGYQTLGVTGVLAAIPVVLGATLLVRHSLERWLDPASRLVRRRT